MSEKKIIVPQDVKLFQQSQGKISPLKVCELLGVELTWYQKEFASYFEYPKILTWDYMNTLWSRRLGKSWVALKVINTLLMTYGSKILLLGHSTSLVDTFFKNIVNDLMSIPQIKDIVKVYKKEGLIEIPELNSYLVTCSQHNWESRSIGRAYNYRVYEEFYLVNPSTQEQIRDLVTPTGSSFGSTEQASYAKEIIISTPRLSPSASYAGRQYLKGLNPEKNPSYISTKYTIYDSAFLKPEEIEHIRKTTNPDSFQQEFMVEFSKTSSTVFRNFDAKKHIINLTKDELREIAKDSILIVGSDYGIVDGYGINFCLYNNKNETYYFIDELYGKGLTSEEVISKLVKVESKIKQDLEIDDSNIVRFTDPANKEFILLAVKKFNLSMNKAKNDRDDGIDYVNKLLQGFGEGLTPKIYFLETCSQTTDMVENSEFKAVGDNVSNQYAQDYDRERRSHYELCDTVRYITYSFYKTSNNQIIVV